jgi:hypothetical protein
VESLRPVATDSIDDNLNRPGLPLGLIGFRISVDTPGDTARVIVYLSEAAPEHTAWYKYDLVNGWSDYSDHAVISADRRTVTLELQDGGFGDQDGCANGVIIDPSGLGRALNDGNGGGCFIMSLHY